MSRSPHPFSRGRIKSFINFVSTSVSPDNTSRESCKLVLSSSLRVDKETTMPMSRTKRLLEVTPLLSGAAAFLLLLTIPAKTQQGAAGGNWGSYGGDTGNTRYSPLSQIDAGNFSKLEVAWIFSTANLGPAPETNLESTPLVIDGVLYSTAGDRRDVIALNAANGELLWTHREDEGRRAEVAPRRLSGRGLAYWADGASGSNDKRIVYFTTGYRMIELVAK